MKARWHYCDDGKNLPKDINKGKVCVFRKGDRAILEVCCLVPDLFQDGHYYWTVKGSTSGKEVFPFAWLEIDANFPPEFFVNLQRLLVLEC